MSDRQKDILTKAVFEYIERAEPISSGRLQERYDMIFSPATIRSELSYLGAQGFLEQLHPSAGRVPTDRGYRFFVDESREEHESEFSDLSLAYHRNTFWKDGWEQLLQEPEFSRNELLLNFTKFLLDVERNIERLGTGKRIQVFIGRENPFSRIGDFSMIVCECDFGRGERGFVAIAGPKRMPYHRNLGLIHSFVDTWKKRLKR